VQVQVRRVRVCRRARRCVDADAGRCGRAEHDDGRLLPGGRAESGHGRRRRRARRTR